MTCAYCGYNGTTAETGAGVPSGAADSPREPAVCPNCGKAWPAPVRITNIDVEQIIGALTGGEAVGVKIGSAPGTVNINLSLRPAAIPTLRTLRAPVADFTGRRADGIG